MIEDLLQRTGGLFAASSRVPGESGAVRLATRVVSVPVHASEPMTGSGTALEDSDARTLAIIEGLERYSASVFSSDQFIVASADDLGGEALDLDMLPRCSAGELAHSRCPIGLPDKTRPMRWVRGLSLSDGRLVYVPVVLVYLHAGLAHPAERFWLPNSSGCAAHVSYEGALRNALLELIERDAVSLVWLQRLQLPRIEVDWVPPALASWWERLQRRSRDLDCLFFDATTDLGVPIVYGLQIAAASHHARTLVSCSAHLQPASALAKVIRDMSSIRAAFRVQRTAPADWDAFKHVFDGATFMADAARAEAFDFLLKSPRSRPLSAMPDLAASPDQQDGEQQELECLLHALQRIGAEAYAVDLTSDEAHRVGIRVVRVIVPALQPLSFSYRARFLGHRRLYDAPARMGQVASPEAQVQSWPQPFA